MSHRRRNNLRNFWFWVICANWFTSTVLTLLVWFLELCWCRRRPGTATRLTTARELRALHVAMCIRLPRHKTLRSRRQPIRCSAVLDADAYSSPTKKADSGAGLSVVLR
jgi:hypothetical protein